MVLADSTGMVVEERVVTSDSCSSGLCSTSISDGICLVSVWASSDFGNSTSTSEDIGKKNIDLSPPFPHYSGGESMHCYIIICTQAQVCSTIVLLLSQ